MSGALASPPMRSIHVARQLSFEEFSSIPQAEEHFSIDESFPEQFADELSRREVFNKHLFRPNTYLHKWWARRCGSTFRTILKQFVSDPAFRDYYHAGGLEGKIVLDPMMGGGTTLHEAIRLGANVIGADIDPIPIVQARATLSQITLRDIQRAFHQFFTGLYQGVGHYFQTTCPICARPTDIQYTLYGLRKTCACGEVIQVDQYELRHEANRTIRIDPHSLEITEDQAISEDSPQPNRLVTKADKRCPSCGQAYQELLDLPYYRRYVPIAIATTCPVHGFSFHPPDEADMAHIQHADAQRTHLDFGPLEDFMIHHGPKSDDLLRHHIHSYLELFSSRQLMYLSQAICQLCHYESTDRLLLGLLVSTSLEFNSLLCGYKGWYKRRPGAIRHVFALHAYSFPYTALENNPVNQQRSSGNLQLLFRDRIERGRKWAAAPVERKIGQDGKPYVVNMPGELDAGIEVFDQHTMTSGNQRFWLIHGDSRHLPIEDHSIDVIVTDPPYYDSVQYSNLAAFFRVWLRHLLPDEVDWTYDESQSAVAVKSTHEVSGFMTVIAGIFAECGRVLKQKTGRLVFTFHHWDPQAWAELTIALHHAGFRLMNAYVVYSEHPISVHINNLRSITHDSILVLALDGNRSPGHWPSLESIATTESETFCRQCSATLGWLLDHDFSEHAIRTTWEHLIDRRTNERENR